MISKRNCLLIFISAAGSFLQTGAAIADSLIVNLDWSQQPAGFAGIAEDLQAKGQLAVPLVFVDGTPVAMLGDRIELSSDKQPIKIEIGSRILRERPLYSFSWPPADAAATTIEVETPLLSQPNFLSGYLNDKGALLFTDVDKIRANIQRSGDRVVIISIAATPYAAIVKTVQETQATIDWTNQQAVKLYSVDKESGRILRPLAFAEVATKPTTEMSKYAVLDKNWSTYQASLFTDFFGAAPREDLLIETQPAGAKVYLSGRPRQGETTNTVVHVLRTLWPEITLRRNKDYCQVVEAAIQPPMKDGDPYRFSCKLIH